MKLTIAGMTRLTEPLEIFVRINSSQIRIGRWQLVVHVALTVGIAEEAAILAKKAC